MPVRAVVILVLVCVCVALAGMMLSGSSAPGGARRSSAAAGPIGEVRAVAGPRSGGMSVRVPVAVDPTAEESGAAAVHIRGRLVDEAGRPVRAGEVVCSIPAAGRVGPVGCDADGRFAVRFAIPVDPRITLEVLAPQRCTMFRALHLDAIGHDIDVGDVVLRAGVLFSGRLVDRAGVPVSPGQLGARVTLRAVDGSTGPGAFDVVNAAVTAVAAGGSFAFRGWWRPGEYQLQVDGLARVDAEPVRLLPPETHVDLVVLRPDEIPELRGVVVDERGEPLHSARVAIGSATSGAGSIEPDRSAADGSFVLRWAPPLALHEPVSLSVARAGYRSVETPAIHSWGAGRVRLVLERAPRLSIRVVRAADDSPVEDFVVRMISAEAARRTAARRGDALTGRTHPGGVVEIGDLQAGDWVVVVEPAADSGLAEGREEVQIGAGAPAPLLIRLEERAEYRK